MWNELVKVNGNFELTFNGHLGGDGAGYRVDANNAGVDVHQMFLNTQFETNGGNGWLRVVEFMKDGQTVKVRTYSPHFDLYRTNSASNLTFTISPVALLGDFNRDGKVDSADYVVWRNTGIHGHQGYDDWRANYGKSGPSFGSAVFGNGAAQVPEPAVPMLTLITATIASICRRSRSPQKT